MFDPEAFVVKGGILVLAALSMSRVILHDVIKILNDFRRWRRHP